jgi:hypothetical protein
MSGAAARIALVLLVALVVGGCGGSSRPRPADTSGIPRELLRESRPIGRGPRFQPLSRRRLASFTAPAGTHVAVFVNGRRRRGTPQSVPLRAHDEIVLEVGPFVPPQRTYTFPSGA